MYLKAVFLDVCISWKVLFILRQRGRYNPPFWNFAHTLKILQGQINQGFIPGLLLPTMCLAAPLDRRFYCCYCSESAFQASMFPTSCLCANTRVPHLPFLLCLVVFCFLALFSLPCSLPKGVETQFANMLAFARNLGSITRTMLGYYPKCDPFKSEIDFESNLSSYCIVGCWRT